MEFGWPFPRRKELLESLKEEKTEKTFPITFQGETRHLAMHRIPIEMPKYRLDNGRTAAHQAEYLAKNPEVPKDFFSADKELELCQTVQHTILKSLINDEGLFEFFKENKQIEPLILSDQGFVVNGNRRICAMRVLLETDPSKFSHFKHVEVCVLPPADAKDIDELEAILQVRKDIKSEYKWTSLAYMFRLRKQNHNYTDEDLGRLYEMKDTEVRELLDMLDYGEQYLNDRNQSGQYHLLDKEEFAFRALRKSRMQIKEEDKKDVFEKISFCLIDEWDGGRVYQAIPDVKKYFEEIAPAIRNEFDLPYDEKEEDEKEEDLLGGGAGKYEDVLEVLKEKNNHSSLREVIKDVFFSEKTKERESKEKNFVALQIKKANTALLEAKNAITEETPKEGIENQVEATYKSLEYIRDWLNGKTKN